MKSFPHALCRLSPSGAHLAAHLQPAAGAVLRTARSSSCTRQPKKKKKKNHAKNPLRTLDSAGDPRLHEALPPGVFLCGCSCPARADHPAAAAADLAARSPGLEQRAEQRRSGRRRCHGGSQAEEGSREEENGSGRRGTGARDPNLQPRLQRSLPGEAPTLQSAPSLPLPPLLLTASLLPAPHRSRRRRTAKPLSLVSLSRFSLAVSSSQTAREKGEGEKNLGVRDD